MSYTSDWEQSHQELLKEWYFEKTSGKEPYLKVHPIVCEGCGKVFYTQVMSKKYCDYYTCGKIGNWKHQRQKRLEQRTDLVCKCCGKTFTPKRKDAVYCSNACRQKAYRQSVTDNQVVKMICSL